MYMNLVGWTDHDRFLPGEILSLLRLLFTFLFFFLLLLNQPTGATQTPALHRRLIKPELVMLQMNKTKKPDVSIIMSLVNNDKFKQNLT